MEEGSLIKLKQFSKIDTHVHLTPEDVIKAKSDHDGKFIVYGGAID